MLRRSLKWVSILVLVVSVTTLIAPSTASAQIFPAGTTALDDVSGGAIRGRAPGRLVQDGVARHVTFNDPQFSRPEITEIELPTSRRAIFLSQALESLFDQLNTAIEAFAALLQVRAGQISIPSLR
jgi:hypothetical protein